MNVILNLELVWVDLDGAVRHHVDQQFQQQNHRVRYPCVGCDTQNDHCYVDHHSYRWTRYGSDEIYVARKEWSGKEHWKSTWLKVFSICHCTLRPGHWHQLFTILFILPQWWYWYWHASDTYQCSIPHLILTENIFWTNEINMTSSSR